MKENYVGRRFVQLKGKGKIKLYKSLLKQKLIINVTNNTFIFYAA